MALSSGRSVTVGANPAAFMWSTHFVQQPQVGVLYTAMGVGFAAVAVFCASAETAANERMRALSPRVPKRAFLFMGAPSLHNTGWSRHGAMPSPVSRLASRADVLTATGGRH